MNRYSIFLVTIGLVFSTFSYAQEPDIDWGEPIKNETPEIRINEIIHANEGGIYAIKSSGPITNEKLKLVKYDPQYKKVSEKEMIPAGSEGVMGNSLLHRQFLYANNKFLKFSLGWKKDEGKGYYYVQDVSLDGEISADGIRLDEAPAEKQLKAANYSIALSPDGKKLMILTEMPFVKKTKEKARVKAYSTDDWKQLWSKDIAFENVVERVPFNEIAIDDKGNGYLVKRVKNADKTFGHTLFTFKDSDGSMKKMELNSDGKMIPQMNLGFNSTGQFIISGFYSTDDKYKIEGTAYFRVNPAGFAVETSKIEPFGTKVLGSFLSPKAASKASASLYKYDMLEAFQRADGSTLLMAEYRDQTKSAIENSGTPPKYNYTHMSGKILLIAIGSDGSRKWNQCIKKNQKVTNTYSEKIWDSFCYDFRNDKLTILWNNFETVGGFGAWTEPDGTKYKKMDVFSDNTVYATWMYEVGADGMVKYSDRKYGLPMANMHQKNMFKMNLSPRVFYSTPKGLIIMSELHNSMIRYKLGLMKL
jgi:hypothetical protein